MKVGESKGNTLGRNAKGKSFRTGGTVSASGFFFCSSSRWCDHGRSQDPKTMAKMMEMHAEVMKSNAAIKYAKQLESGK